MTDSTEHEIHPAQPRATNCVWIAWDDQGRPKCEHGWAVPNGHGYWTCPAKALARSRRLNKSEKGRARSKVWNNSDAGRKAKRKYGPTRPMRFDP